MPEESGRKRTIDERIDALTMNMELMSHTVEANREVQERRMDRIMTAIEKLVTVMESHERRITGLEGE